MCNLAFGDGAAAPKSSQHSRLIDDLCTNRTFLRGSSTTLGAGRRMAEVASGASSALMPALRSPARANTMPMGLGMGMGMGMGAMGGHLALNGSPMALQLMQLQQAQFQQMMHHMQGGLSLIHI